MMKRARLRISMCVVVVCVLASIASADTFDEGGANEFTIDFVNISGDASSANGTNISQSSPGEFAYKTFTDPGDYRIGRLEVSNEKWNSYCEVTGSPSSAFEERPYFSGTNIPTNHISWLEAAQFVNYLNTSTGHAAAYKFTGTQGTSDFTLTAWDVLDNGYDEINSFRNSNAKYFLPTENEWVKAAYWNGISLQTYATTNGSVPTAGADTNYDSYAPWDVDNGSEELNGTKNMMGNVFELTESRYYDEIYTPTTRCARGGDYTFIDYGNAISSSNRYGLDLDAGGINIGFRVASVPEPTTLLLLGLGAVMVRKKTHLDNRTESVKPLQNWGTGDSPAITIWP